MDISSDMNSIASKRIAAAGFGDRVDIIEGDATALVFADATFDAAVSMQVIEYLAEPDAALDQRLRGTSICQTPTLRARSRRASATPDSRSTKSGSSR